VDEGELIRAYGMTELVFGEVAVCRHCKGVHAINEACDAKRQRLLGEQARDVGMERVLAAESSDWPRRAERWVMSLPHGRRFTAEDLCDAIGRPGRANSVGARLSALAKSGRIVAVGYEKAERMERHASRMLTWEKT